MLDDCLPDLPWEGAAFCAVQEMRLIGLAKRIRLKRVFGVSRYMLQIGRLELTSSHHKRDPV